MIFPTNVAGVTVWEKTNIDRSPAYVRHTFGASYWEDTRGQTVMASDARSPSDSCFIAIPAKSISDYIPKKDDRIVCEICEDEQPPSDALTVMQVKNFLYGSSKMQHLEVNAK